MAHAHTQSGLMEGKAFSSISSLFLIGSWKRPTTCCVRSRTRQRGWGRATRRWRSQWASWRAWTASCRRGAAGQTERRRSWRRRSCFFRAPWTRRGGTTAKDPRRSGNCKVTGLLKHKCHVNGSHPSLLPLMSDMPGHWQRPQQTNQSLIYLSASYLLIGNKIWKS